VRVRSICRWLWHALRLLWPWFLLARLTNPIPPGLWLVNVFMQRVLRVNGQISWMVNFTSTVTGNIHIGKNVWKSFALSGGCYVQGGNGIRIGDDTIFAPGVKIISSNHSFDDFNAWIEEDPIVIGRNCWIGANAVILPGVTLGDRVVVGAGAVVTKSFPERTIIAGVPARCIGTISTVQSKTNDSPMEANDIQTAAQRSADAPSQSSHG
jgi:acetyltransferase-like isoleucine patch superfamily enzyme